MHMRVEFYRSDDGRTCGWVATPPGRRPFEGTTMAAGRDLPHDLAQFVVERALGVHEGFWGLLANGATFKSVPGRRLTQPGRALVREHTTALEAIEGVANAHVDAWRRGAPTPVGAALDVMYARWLALPAGERLCVEWEVRRLAPSCRRARRAGRRAGRAR
jgi:hypothetical protein